MDTLTVAPGERRAAFLHETMKKIHALGEKSQRVAAG